MLQNLSYWEKDTYLDTIDFAIIGSGIVGLNAAITLKEKYPNAKIVVLERGVFPSGASTKNAGFACFGSISELIADTKIMGLDGLLNLVDKRWRGLARLKELCGEEAIDYQQHGGYELFIDVNDFYKECEGKISFFNEKLAPILGVKDVFKVEEEKGKFGFGKVKKLIYNKAEGQINPAKMMRQLKFLATTKGIDILTNLKVINFEEQGESVYLNINDNQTIVAAKVLIATNGFSKQLLPRLTLQPARNQVLITEPIPNLKIKGTFHFDQGYYYFRNVDNRILLGGARNRAKAIETTDQFGLTPLIQQTLEQFLKEVILPDQSFEIAHRWSGILGVGNQKTPIVYKYSEHIGVAVRLGGMGVAIGSLVGEEGAELF